MAESGLDLATWLTIVGVFVLFFGLPLATLEYDRRKALRASSTTPGKQAVSDER